MLFVKGLLDHFKMNDIFNKTKIYFSKYKGKVIIHLLSEYIFNINACVKVPRMKFEPFALACQNSSSSFLKMVHFYQTP